MLKKLLLAAALSLATSSAFAACTNPLPILNGSAASVNMSVSQNTADAGCMYNVTPNQGGAPLSNTNGWWTNILQGNAVLSATNGLYANLLIGNAAPSATNPIWVSAATGATFNSAQSGTWTVQPGNTPNTTAWLFNMGAMGGTNIASGCTAALSGFSTTIPATVCPVGGTYVLNTLPPGSALSASSSPVVIASDQAAVATKAASGAFVAGSIADLAHGQGTMAASVPVAIASNQSAFPVTINAGTASIGSVFGPTAVGSANANPPVVIGGTATGAAGANVQGLSIVAPSTAPVTATNTAVVVDLRPDSPGIITLGPASVANSVPQTFSSQYPTNATTTTPTAVTASATGTTAATAASLGATASVTNFVCGFTISAAATSLTTGTATLSGTVSGSLSYIQTVQAVASGAAVLTQNFNPCIPASAANTAITITSAAAGTLGNTIVNIWGYRL